MLCSCQCLHLVASHSMPQVQVFAMVLVVTYDMQVAQAQGAGIMGGNSVLAAHGTHPPECVTPVGA
jgi:hypothetical protein